MKSPSEYTYIPIASPPNTQGLDSTTFQVPPLDGSILFPELHDWQYHNSPDHPVFAFPDPTDPTVTKEICYKESVPAIHRAGRIVSSMFNYQVPAPADKAPVVAIFAVSGYYLPIFNTA